ncbi:hypothetical protein lerEdw1_015727 [Lerista edwardsae]|nr:hypothetical protein lerEdw1_015727 [Lerista edwardsae]
MCLLLLPPETFGEESPDLKPKRILKVQDVTRDGLKLETEMLDGKTRLILAPCVGKSKPSVKVFNKNRPLKHTLKTKQNGHVLKSVQTTCEKNECVTKHKPGTRLLETKTGKNHETSVSTKDSSKEFCSKDHAFITEKDNTTAKSDNTGISVKKPLPSNKKFKKHPVSEDLRDNLVCLTQEQLEQILKAVKGTKAVSQLPVEKKKETNSNSLADQAPEEENIMGLLQKAGESSYVPSENSIISNRKHGSPKRVEHKHIMNSWKPGDMFSTLGERERDKTLLDAKKSQWKKELDEQIALKKKLKEISEAESKCPPRQKYITMKSTEKVEMAKHAKMAFSDDLNPTIEDIHTCRILTTEASEASPSISSGQSGQFSSFSSPDLPAAIRTAFVLGEATPMEHPFSAIKREQQKKWLEELDKQKEADKLRKIEEKCNLSKKAIMAQVEEKRKKKQLEEEQRRLEEQEEEHRLAREQELMKKQFEEDLLRQKQKEEIMTLKTNELYQTMQKAQELAQRLKQEQRIKDLAQKGHDISKLQKNLDSGDAPYESYCADLNGFSEVGNHLDNGSEENSSVTNQDIKIILSPRKDTAVQTESVHTDVHPSSEICTRQIGNGSMDCISPDVCIEYKVDSNSKKCKKEPQNLAKKKISEKENIVSYSNLYEQLAENQKQARSMERNGKRPDWNINKPCKRYIPASERYPRRLQKQREEKKARRQMELLQLVERNSPGNLSQKKGVSPDRSPSPLREEDKNKGEPSPKTYLIAQRSESPPIPAIKNKLQQQIKASDFPTHNSNDGRDKTIYADKPQSERFPPCVETERPPSSHFVPYVRTNEVYYLDPDAPMTRPSTHEPQYHQLNDTLHTPRQIFSSDHIRDPLFNPNMVRDRQQAILKGLSELRQGLLQKQKELETCLIPSTINQEETFISPF